MDTASWHPKVRELYEYWAAIGPGGGKLPGRKDFDPLTVPHLLPNVMLLDVVGRPPRFRYRLVGTRMVDALGRDLTGHWLDEAHSRPDGGRPQFPSYERVALEGEADWRRGHPHFMSYLDKCTEIERVFLPLAADGRHVDMILTIVVFFDIGGIEL